MCQRTTLSIVPNNSKQVRLRFSINMLDVFVTEARRAIMTCNRRGGTTSKICKSADN